MKHASNSHASKAIETEWLHNFLDNSAGISYRERVLSAPLVRRAHSSSYESSTAQTWLVLPYRRDFELGRLRSILHEICDKYSDSNGGIRIGLSFKLGKPHLHAKLCRYGLEDSENPLGIFRNMDGWMGKAVAQPLVLKGP